MATDQLNQLKNRLFRRGRKGSATETGLTNILDMTREFSCLGEIIGREYSILDKKGNLIYTIKQKPMKIKQLNTLLKEFVVLKTLDNQREAAKWGTKKGSKRLRKPKKV